MAAAPPPGIRRPCATLAAVSNEAPPDASLKAPRERGRRPVTAAFFSFLFPGAGQLYAGARRAAALFAIPVILLILFIGIQAAGGVETFAAQMIAPSFALLTLAGIVVVGAWRLASIG